MRLHGRARGLVRHRRVGSRSGVGPLRGLLPMCSSCKKIRDDRGDWQMLESYLDAHSEAQLSHGLCPTCAMDILNELSPAGDQD